MLKNIYIYILLVVQMQVCPPSNNSVKSTGYILDKCSCKLKGETFILIWSEEEPEYCTCKFTKALFYHWHGQCEVFTCTGRIEGDRANPEKNGDAPEFCHM